MKIKFFKSLEEDNKLGERETFLREVSSSVVPCLGELVLFDGSLEGWRVIDVCSVYGDEDVYFEILLFEEQ
jgi:hypothetical protein